MVERRRDVDGTHACVEQRVVEGVPGGVEVNRMNLRGAAQRAESIGVPLRARSVAALVYNDVAARLAVTAQSQSLGHLADLQCPESGHGARQQPARTAISAVRSMARRRAHRAFGTDHDTAALGRHVPSP